MRRMFIALAMVGIAVAAPLLARGDDKEIARQLIAKLKVEKAAGRLQGFDVDLKVEKGVVWLRGQAASAEQEQIALETARLTPGVVSVMKNIRVGDAAKTAVAASSSSSATGDAAQTAPMRTDESAARVAEETPRTSSRRNPQEESLLQLLTGPAIPQPVSLAASAPQTAVAATTIQTPAQVSEIPAPQLGFSIEPASPGPVQAMHTVSVNNPHIPVQPASANQPAPVSTTDQAPVEEVTTQDQDITQRLGSQLKRAIASGRLDGRNLAFKVEKGVVWLRGAVISSDQEQLVVTAAQTTPGVSKVYKDIQVTPVQDAYIDSRTITSNSSATVQAAATQPVQNAKQAGQTAGAGKTAATAAGLQKTGPVQPQLMPVNPYYGYPYAGYYPAPNQAPVAFAPAQPASAEIADSTGAAAGAAGMQPYGPGVPVAPVAFGGTGVRYDHPHLPAYSWPSYAAYPNYGAVTYPKTYSPTVWPYIGPFYPYPQVPLGWRKVTLEWDDGWWQLDFQDQSRPWKMR